MKHTYHIQGMSCNGCKNHVQEALSKVPGVLEASVDLEKEEATIEMEEHIMIETFQQALDGINGNYSIHPQGSHVERKEEKKAAKPEKGAVYYCPMHCEGDKTYPAPGNCPVCGMDLVAQPGVAKTEEDDTYSKLKRKFVIAVIFTVPVFLISMSEMLPGDPLYSNISPTFLNWAQLVLSIPVVFYATWMFFQRAYASIIRRSPNMFTLIGIGAGVAWTFSVVALLIPGIFPEQFLTSYGTVHVYFESATVILTLVLLGQLLEARAHGKTNAAIRSLLELSPSRAVRITNGEEVEVSIDEILVGDVLRVRPGGSVPVDGKIVQGEASIDESMISGEPIPVDKEIGDQVVAGTINGTSSFLMEAEKIGSETMLSRIIEMVQSASMSQAPIQKTVDRISAWFVPIVVLVSVITFILWVVFGPSPQLVYAFVNAIAVLIIACPCALGLASPMSVMVGIGKGAGEGVLFKNAEAFEVLNKLDVLVIDKTGTLTEGKPSLESIHSEVGEADDLLRWVAAVNSNSEHPLATVLVKRAKEKELQFSTAEEFASFPGKGVKGRAEGKWILIGNKRLMDDESVKPGPELLEAVEREEKMGKTVPMVAVDGVCIGYVVISDAIKPTSKEAVAFLKQNGVRVVMMTGDNEGTASAVANSVGIEEYEAACLPEDKLNKIKAFQEQGLLVGMVGDGVNDAPALAKADIGIAMGTGSDIAIENASVTLVKGDLMGVHRALSLSKSVLMNIRQNLFFALVYNTIGIPIAAGVLFPFFGLLLSPMIAALAMSFSSVSVISNALRLRLISLK